MGVVRGLLISAVLLVLYYVLPLDREWSVAVALGLLGGLVVVGAVIIWQVRGILGSPHPVLQAVETLALAIPFYLLLFATAYFVMASSTSGTFTQPLTRTDSLYFSITVFATVGFGDIAPVSEVARLLVSAQMLLDLVLLGGVLRAVVQAARLGAERNRGPGARALGLGGSGGD